MRERFDAAVIGTGPAGLSAAITLKIRGKNLLLLGNRKISEKVGKAHEIQNYLGLPEIQGEAMGKQFENHLSSLGISVTEETAAAVYPMGDYFQLFTKDNRIYEASTVILATGISFGKPYPGEKEFLGRGVSYCAVCDAMFYKGKKTVLVGQTKEAEKEAEFMKTVAGQVVYLPLYSEPPALSEEIEVIREVPARIMGEERAETMLFVSGGEIKADGFFFLRESVMPSMLLSGLAMEGRHIAVDRQMCTNEAGCFACGDITGKPYQYIKAAGEGNVAALSAVRYLER